MTDEYTDDIEHIGDNASARLKAFIERIERLNEEKDAIADDTKDVYAEAKGTGFDVKVLRKVIQRRKMDADLRAEQDQILEMYENAIAELKEMME